MECMDGQMQVCVLEETHRGMEERITSEIKQQEAWRVFREQARFWEST